MNNNEDKDKQWDNLLNLVENHTRTQRHLEQYADIGDPDNKENAMQKQEVREEQIGELIKNINGEHDNETKEEQLENIVENYVSSEGYIHNNADHMPEDMIRNIKKKQENREEQLENLKQNLE